MGNMALNQHIFKHNMFAKAIRQLDGSIALLAIRAALDRVRLSTATPAPHRQAVGELAGLVLRLDRAEGEVPETAPGAYESKLADIPVAGGGPRINRVGAARGGHNRRREAGISYLKADVRWFHGARYHFDLGGNAVRSKILQRN